MTRRLVGAVSLVLFAFPAIAGDITFYGVGNDKCGTWTSVFSDENHKKELKQWALGYLAGYTASSDVNLVKGIDASVILEQIIKLCRNHAETPVAIIVNEVALILKDTQLKNRRLNDPPKYPRLNRPPLD